MKWGPRTVRFGVGCDAMVRIASGPNSGYYIGFEVLVLSDGRERLGWHRRLGQIALSASFFSNWPCTHEGGQKRPHFHESAVVGLMRSIVATPTLKWRAMARMGWPSLSMALT